MLQNPSLAKFSLWIVNSCLSAFATSEMTGSVWRIRNGWLHPHARQHLDTLCRCSRGKFFVVGGRASFVYCPVVHTWSRHMGIVRSRMRVT